MLLGCNSELPASAVEPTVFARQSSPPAADGQRSGKQGPDTGADNKAFKAYSLTIYGYNYTDSEIGSFEVNGRGGGNLAVSTPTSAGGSSACCAAIFTPLPPDNTVRIKWSRDGDTWCEQDVPFSGPVPEDAEYLEVHFYRDGRIELAATPRNSPPRLKLTRLHGNSRHADPTKNVNHDDRFASCKRGY